MHSFHLLDLNLATRRVVAGMLADLGERNTDKEFLVLHLAVDIPSDHSNGVEVLSKSDSCHCRMSR
jgi:hypothetical protein